jgi:hypothetical protein
MTYSKPFGHHNLQSEIACRHMGNGCTDTRFLDLSTSWRRVVSFMPLPLYPQGKIPWYPLERMFSAAQRWSGQHGGVKILELHSGT